MSFVQIDFQPMQKQEFKFSEDLPHFEPKKYKIIDHKEAREIYFPQRASIRAEGGMYIALRTPVWHPTNVHIVSGGQRGDEGKGKATELIAETEEITWVLAPNSTHNAGKGLWTENEGGEPVRLSFHLCPATIARANVMNYIGSNTQINPFILKKELCNLYEGTGRSKLGENYHLMVDRRANIMIPTNRAEDILCQANAMGSTISGATASYKYASAKMAPTIDDILYDEDAFIGSVEKQIEAFEDRLSHDKELNNLGIVDFKTFGEALERDDLPERMKALQKKLGEKEKQFFKEENPALYLHEEYKKIVGTDYFEVGCVQSAISAHLRKGEKGIVEGVQSSLLSGKTKYSKNRTAAATDSLGTLGDAVLLPELTNTIRTSVFKYGNTSVGGMHATLSGFIRQDALSQRTMNLNGEIISFERTDTIDRFLSIEEIEQAYTELNDAFHEAIKNGHSLKYSQVHIPGISEPLPLAEARALFTAYMWGERGETTGRARTCRFDDMVETKVIYDLEGDTYQIRNAVDRAETLPYVGIVTHYKTIAPYRDYEIGSRIVPGTPLSKEHKTVETCIPVITFMPSWNQSIIDGYLHKNLANYLSLVSQGRKVIAIGTGPKTKDIQCIKEV